FASGVFGMISGSSIANTVTVGSLTIPMMIRIGYPRHFAGAVESTAATGGQITPPIMGAAAFLMVEYLSLPYQTIILAAIVPAFMHFFGVFCQVHFEAKKLGMRGLTSAALPGARAGYSHFLPTWLFDASALTMCYTLVMPALVCILQGCGVPTTANYNIKMTIAHPVLPKLGVATLMSHFIVFYHVGLADITPP